MLTASGTWGVVHEPAESGPFNAGVLEGSPAILTNIDMFDALHAAPDMITVAGGQAEFGPRAINITLTQVCPPREEDSLCYSTSPHFSATPTCSDALHAAPDKLTVASGQVDS